MKAINRISIQLTANLTYKWKTKRNILWKNWKKENQTSTKIKKKSPKNRDQDPNLYPDPVFL